MSNPREKLERYDFPPVGSRKPKFLKHLAPQCAAFNHPAPRRMIRMPLRDLCSFGSDSVAGHKDPPLNSLVHSKTAWPLVYGYTVHTLKGVCTCEPPQVHGSQRYTGPTCVPVYQMGLGLTKAPAKRNIRNNGHKAHCNKLIWSATYQRAPTDGGLTQPRRSKSS